MFRSLIACFAVLGLANLTALGSTQEKLSLEWPQPVRAMPGLEMRFKFAVQNPQLEVLTWSIANAPKGMRIDNSGVLRWTPSSSQGTATDVNVLVTGDRGGRAERKFTVNVNQSDFILVLQKDANPLVGALPKKQVHSLEEALALVESNKGKSILLAPGIHEMPKRWEELDRHPLQGKSFATDNVLEILNYGNSSAIIDCRNTSDGLCLLQTRGLRVSGVTIANAKVNERGAFSLMESSFINLELCCAKAAQGLTANNPCGFLVRDCSEVILTECAAIDCRDLDSDAWNSTSFLLYTSGEKGHLATLSGCQSTGSIVGFKVKHAGPKTVLLQDCQSLKEEYGFGMSAGTAILRGCVAWESGFGLQIGVTDPNKRYTTGGMLVENCAFIRCGAGLELQYADDAGYGSGPKETIVRRSLFLSEKKAGTGERDARHLELWPYQAASGISPDACKIRFSECLHIGPSEKNLVRLGDGEGKDLATIAELETRGLSKSSAFRNLGAIELSNQQIAPSKDSGASLHNDTFIGPVAPGKVLKVGNLLK